MLMKYNEYIYRMWLAWRCCIFGALSKWNNHKREERRKWTSECVKKEERTCVYAENIIQTICTKRKSNTSKWTLILANVKRSIWFLYIFPSVWFDGHAISIPVLYTQQCNQKMGRRIPSAFLFASCVLLYGGAHTMRKTSDVKIIQKDKMPVTENMCKARSHTHTQIHLYIQYQ